MNDSAVISPDMLKSMMRAVFAAILCVVAVALSACSRGASSRDASAWSATGIDCGRAFVIQLSDRYYFYQWGTQGLTLLHSGKYAFPEWFIFQAAYQCQLNELVTTLWREPRLASKPFLGFDRKRSDGQADSIFMFDGPTNSEQYQDRVLFDTNLLKAPDTGSKDVARPTPPANIDNTYVDLIDYNLVTNRIEARYPYGGTHFMMRVGRFLYLMHRNGRVMSIDLDKKTSTQLFRQPDSIRLERYTVTGDGRVFMLITMHTQMDGDALAAYKMNTVYEIVDGKAVKVLETDLPDTIGMLGVGKDVYVFTQASQVLKYDTDDKTITRYTVPFQHITNVNYFDGHFVICYNPDGNRMTYQFVVTDNAFRAVTAPLTLPRDVNGIATAHWNSGGESW
jgi:hypothetical protein